MPPHDQIEEGMLAFREVLPRAWWNIYQGCLQAGFNQLQSFSLIQTYILAQNPYGIRPNDSHGPVSDKP